MIHRESHDKTQYRECVIAGQREQITSTIITIDTHTDFCGIAKGKKQIINTNDFDLNEYTQFKGDAMIATL